MMKLGALMVAGLLASAASATSLGEYLTSDAGDPFAVASIQNGRYDSAERKLDQAYARGDRSPEVLLNLAALRSHAGRDSQPLYREVLQQPNVSLVTLSGTTMSHDLAQRGLGGR